jgi:phosphoribosylanthranilate isomerase
VKVQIYSLTSAEEAVACVDVGVDFVGVVVEVPPSVPEALAPAGAREILAAIRPRATGVALTLDEDREKICKMVDEVRPDVVHIASAVPRPADVAWIARRIVPVRVMRAIGVNAAESITFVCEYEGIADYLLLDSRAPGASFAGATGKTHDWRISREIVEVTRVPVILAGGLSPENVADAIATVRPWGVDSFTHTDVPGQRGKKDLSRVRAFVDAARRAAGTAGL